MFAGIDIGSSSSEVAIIDKEKNIISLVVVNMGTGTKAPEEALNMALEEAKITRDEIEYCVVTGYGRITYNNADKQITEISCHAKGVNYLLPGVSSIIDIGGQDSKVIKLDSSGKVVNFVMNDKCAAGTGRFLEVMSRVLGCTLSELSEMAAKSTADIDINNTCTVFAESEVISKLSTGESRENVARGAHLAIARRTVGLARRVGFEPRVAMTGGVALNKDLVYCLSKELGTDIEVAPKCQAAGAIGAALFALENFEKENK